MRKSKSFMFTCPAEDLLPDGTFVGLSDMLLTTVKLERNRRNVTPWLDGWARPCRWVIRYRYRGPRRPGVEGQSMCLKRDATSCDVYLYLEARERRGKSAKLTENAQNYEVTA